MARLCTITWGTERFRVGPWQADDRVAYLAAGPHAPEPSPIGINAVLDRLRNDGFVRVVTSALRPEELPPYLASGFTERERLVVLHRAVSGHRPPIGRSVRRLRPHEMSTLIDVDHAAFEPPWQLDTSGIREALGATPRSRLRVASGTDDSPRGVRAYAICGRAGSTGYLQRLAVHPDDQGLGLGRGLIGDAMAWLGRRRATRVMVNTQRTNHRALDLYVSLGFEPDRGELMVLERPL